MEKLPPPLLKSILEFAVPGYAENLPPARRNVAISTLNELKLVAEAWEFPIYNIVQQYCKSTLSIVFKTASRFERKKIYRQVEERGEHVSELFVCMGTIVNSIYPRHFTLRPSLQGVVEGMDFDWARVFASLPGLKLINLSEMDLASTHIVAALEAAAKYCPKLESLTLPYAEKGVNAEHMRVVLRKLFAGLQHWCVKRNIGGIRHLNVPTRTWDDPFRASEEFFENVMTSCPQLEYLDGYKMSLCTENRLTCKDIWLLKLCDWERFNATCTKLREFHWVVVPFGDPYFRVFGEHLKPQLKKLSFGVAMNWNWRWYFYDTSEAAGDIPIGDWEQQNYCERPGYGFLASDVSAALKGCPLLDELQIQLYHPKDLGFGRRFAFDGVYDDIPDHEMVNVNMFDDQFCETLVACCPFISRFGIIEVAERCNSKNVKPIETFTDRGLMVLSRLTFLQTLQLRSVNCTGKGVFEFLNSLSDEFMGNRVFEIAIGESGSALTFYDELKELLSEIAETSELLFERKKFVLRLENCSYRSRSFVNQKWSGDYFNELEELMFRELDAHPTLRQLVVTRGRKWDSFKRIAEFGLHSVLAPADLYSEWENWEVEQDNDGIMIRNRAVHYEDIDVDNYASDSYGSGSYRHEYQFDYRDYDDVDQFSDVSEIYETPWYR